MFLVDPKNFSKPWKFLKSKINFFPEIGGEFQERDSINFNSQQNLPNKKGIDLKLLNAELNAPSESTNNSFAYNNNAGYNSVKKSKIKNF